MWGRLVSRVGVLSGWAAFRRATSGGFAWSWTPDALLDYAANVATSCRDSNSRRSYHAVMNSHEAAGAPASGPRSGDGLPVELVLGGGSMVQQVGRDLRTAVESRLAPFGVTSQQAALLLHSVRGQTSPNQLAPLLGTDTAGMTRLLDRLEAKGLILRRRHEGDRRSIVIEVTEEGKALAPKLAPVFGQAGFQLLRGFSEQELRLLTGMLRRMLDNLRGGGESPAEGPEVERRATT